MACLESSEVPAPKELQNPVRAVENQPSTGVLTMKSGKPLNIHARLGASRLTATERLDALASLQRGEAIADLIHAAARELRRAGEDAGRAFRKAGQGVSRLGRSYR